MPEPFMPSRLAFRRCLRAVLTVAASLAVTVSMAATNVIELERDAAGNITKIKRQAAAVLSVTGFTPASGAVGSSVTVYGSGFAALAGDNLVKFNGVSTTVSTVGTGSLAVRYRRPGASGSRDRPARTS